MNYAPTENSKGSTSTTANATSGLTVAFAGGGTGGHIYPALAMARSLESKGYRIVFLGSEGGLEANLVPREGFPIFSIRVGKLHQSVGRLAQLKTLFLMPYSLIQSFMLLYRIKPDLVVGVGGYVSGPFLLMALVLRLRTCLWEPNAYPGLTNRWLAPFVDLVLVVFDRALLRLKTKRGQVVGMPVRSSIVKATRPPLSNRKLRVLVFGGSQGARTINESVSEAIVSNPAQFHNVEIVHQTGSRDHARIKEKYETAGFNQPTSDTSVSCHEYLYDMPDRYTWADVVFCRAGASTIAEVSAAGKAVVLIPFPFASDDHQKHNAQVLVEKGAARMVLNHEFTPDCFARLVHEFLDDPKKIDSLEKSIENFHHREAGQQITNYLSSLLKRN